MVLYAKSYMKAESELWPRDRILLQVLFLKIRSCFLVSWNSLGTGTNTEPSSLNPKISVWSHFSISVWSHRVIDAFLNCISVSKQREYFKRLSAKHKYKITFKKKYCQFCICREKRNRYYAIFCTSPLGEQMFFHSSRERLWPTSQMHLKVSYPTLPSHNH